MKLSLKVTLLILILVGNVFAQFALIDDALAQKSANVIDKAEFCNSTIDDPKFKRAFPDIKKYVQSSLKLADTANEVLQAVTWGEYKGSQIWKILLFANLASQLSKETENPLDTINHKLLLIELGTFTAEWGLSSSIGILAPNLSGVAAWANLASLPITSSILAFVKMVDNFVLKRQLKYYNFARGTGCTYDSIVNGGCSAVLLKENGWLYNVDYGGVQVASCGRDYKGCYPLSSIKPSEFYEYAEFLWNNPFPEIQKKYEKDKNSLKDELQKRIEICSDSINSQGSDNEHYPFVTSLVLDRSGSMGEQAITPDGKVIPNKNKLESAKQATSAFIQAMNDNDRIAFSTFSDDATTEISFNSVHKVKQTLDDTLDSVRPGRGTNIGAGLEKGASELQQADDKSLVMALLLSDGENNDVYNDYLWDMVEKYKNNNWPICTIGFGKEAGEEALIKIAKMTGCTYEYAESTDISSKYQGLAAYAKAQSTDLSAKDLLAEKGRLVYDFIINVKSELFSFFSSWGGSKLKTVLIAPDGTEIEDTTISAHQGRYVEGKTFQMLEINNPAPGKWQVELTWKEAPPAPEQVNILVTEKTDVFARIHGLRSQYSLGQTVDINTDAFEVVNNRKIPLKKAMVKIEVKKPGEEVIRLIQAQSTSWTMYKDVLADIRRDVTMFDDGAHSDYHPQDGIFGGSFAETDKNGVYLVTATITGQKQNGEAIEKTIINTFQVGSIMNNLVSTSQTLHYIQQAEENLDNSTPVSTDLLNQPVEEIDQLQQGSDPLDEINQLLQ